MFPLTLPLLGSLKAILGAHSKDVAETKGHVIFGLSKKLSEQKGRVKLEKKKKDFVA
jgi:hypothetical protein